MRFWWVNQNQTYKHEVRGGFLWSPKANRNGRGNRFYDNMTETRRGDLVFSFCDTQVKAVGVVSDRAVSAEKPNFGAVGDQWDNEGWYVPVEFRELEHPVRPKDFIADLLPQFRGKYDPLQPNGNGNQGVYLAEVSEGFAKVVLDKIGHVIADFVTEEEADSEAEEQADRQALEGRTDIGETQKRQLVLSRRGQGIFKANVRLNEQGCRVTGVTDQALLVASHIKPWAHSTDREKLDGCNGLLLSPHVDRLFDRGLITFSDDGALIRSSTLKPAVLSAWGISEVRNVGAFAPEQAVYLAYHRSSVFRP